MILAIWESKNSWNSSASLLSGVMGGNGDSCFLCKSPFTILYMALKSVLFSVMMFL